MANLFDVTDKVVVITGGLGQLGRRFSFALAEQGANVAIFDCRAAASDEKLSGKNIMPISVDVARRDSIEAALRQVVGRWGVPHGLINAAALDSPPDAPAEENGPFEGYPETSWNEVMDVNVKGVFLCCQVIGGEMASARRGSIINIGSIYGLLSPDQRIYEYRRAKGAPFFKPVAYSVSKSAIINLTRYLATYWGQQNVRVNTLTFGGVYNNQDEQFVKAYSERVPLGRLAREDEYNWAIIFLLSEASSYMTGANLIIDGGWTAW
jgi:NAD(P)-dependent dehydrogenase (short-subunit alcohol dehydrogenase family)